jgi:hypothetical protein
VGDQVVDRLGAELRNDVALFGDGLDGTDQQREIEEACHVHVPPSCENAVPALGTVPPPAPRRDRPSGGSPGLREPGG